MNNTFCNLSKSLAMTGTELAQAEDALGLTALLYQLAANALHAHQYGVLVFHSAIDIDVKVNWGNLRHALHHVNPMTVGHDGMLEWRGCGQQRITLHAVATTMYSQPDMDLDIKIELVSAQFGNLFYITAYL